MVRAQGSPGTGELEAVVVHAGDDPVAGQQAEEPAQRIGFAAGGLGERPGGPGAVGQQIAQAQFRGGLQRPGVHDQLSLGEQGVGVVGVRGIHVSTSVVADDHGFCDI